VDVDRLCDVTDRTPHTWAGRRTTEKDLPVPGRRPLEATRVDPCTEHEIVWSFGKAREV
jgi:hypothetical protein